jgi:curved DNA-binding protein CbpA
MDAFVVLGMPRRPVVDEDALKEAYLSRARSLHPDQEQGDARRFAELREAHELLRNPTTRLQHLVELEFGRTLSIQPPIAFFHLFQSVCELVETAKAAMSKASDATQPLAKALAARTLSEVNARCDLLLVDIADLEASLQGDLLSLDARWPTMDGVDALVAGYSFVSKARTQVEEIRFELVQSLRSTVSR